METLLRKIEELKARDGIDILGFGPKERFASLPPQSNPFSIFPEGETVILLGKRICRGSLRGVEEGTNFADYNLFGNTWLEDEFLAIACYDLTCVLENEGWEAVPIFPNPTEIGPMGVPVAEGRPAPDVLPDFAYSAVACGTAEIARSGLVFTPQFGSRQRFHMVITDAILPATPLLLRPVCDGCGLCVKSCPLGAISREETEEITVCGKVMRTFKVNYELCRQCKNGAVPCRFSAKIKPDRIAAACNRTCMCHLEEEKLIDSLFENRFRQGASWALDRDGGCLPSQDRQGV